MIRANTSSQDMVKHLDKLTPILAMNAESMPVEQLYSQLDLFEKSMD